MVGAVGAQAGAAALFHHAAIGTVAEDDRPALDLQVGVALGHAAVEAHHPAPLGVTLRGSRFHPGRQGEALVVQADGRGVGAADGRLAVEVLLARPAEDLGGVGRLPHRVRRGYDGRSHALPQLVAAGGGARVHLEVAPAAVNALHRGPRRQLEGPPLVRLGRQPGREVDDMDPVGRAAEQQVLEPAFVAQALAGTRGPILQVDTALDQGLDVAAAGTIAPVLDEQLVDEP
ncbi:MAG: hypothetical protein IPL60_04970 [Ardenticatenia bacterium]|nr:hypothetical protein [Ardenticatenia bacterium]